MLTCVVRCAGAPGDCSSQPSRATRAGELPVHRASAAPGVFGAPTAVRFQVCPSQRGFRRCLPTTHRYDSEWRRRSNGGHAGTWTLAQEPPFRRGPLGRTGVLSPGALFTSTPRFKWVAEQKITDPPSLCRSTAQGGDAAGAMTGIMATSNEWARKAAAAIFYTGSGAFSSLSPRLPTACTILGCFGDITCHVFPPLSLTSVVNS